MSRGQRGGMPEGDARKSLDDLARRPFLPSSVSFPPSGLRSPRCLSFDPQPERARGLSPRNVPMDARRTYGAPFSLLIFQHYSLDIRADFAKFSGMMLDF